MVLPTANVETFYELKGSTLLGIVRALQETGLLEPVRAKVSLETRALLDAPPAATAWLGNACSVEIYAAIAQLRGMPYVRTFNRLALSLGVVPIARMLIEGTLRLFGSSPSNLYSRVETLMQVGTRGLRWEYRSLGLRADEIIAGFPRAKAPVPEVTLELFAGTLEKLAELCGAEASVSYARLPGNEQRVCYQIAWRPKR